MHDEHGVIARTALPRSVLAVGTATYLYGPSTAPGSAQGGRLGQYQTSMQYFGADGLGSVRQIFDASAQVVGSSRYDPFGNVMSQGGTTSVFAFAGEQYDSATGLTYLRARYYSAAQGRFTTRDTWEGDQLSPLTLNAWNYTNGNPVNYADPAGMSTGGELSPALPRTASMCVQPPNDPQLNKPGAHGYIHGDQAWIYCGEFALTAYQFVEDQGYAGSPSAIPTPAPRPTPVPTSTPHPATTTSMTFGVRAVSGFSSEFIADVRDNGTGYSTRAELTAICSDGYFSGLDSPNGPVCGTGRGIRLEQAYHIVASDPKVIPLSVNGQPTELTIPGLATTARNLPHPSGEGTNLTVFDTGSEVRNYHLDVFVGQGPGIRANWPGAGINSPSNQFTDRHQNLGKLDITLSNGRRAQAVGRTSVYQHLRVSQLTGELLQDLLCRSE